MISLSPLPLQNVTRLLLHISAVAERRALSVDCDEVDAGVVTRSRAFAPTRYRGTVVSTMKIGIGDVFADRNDDEIVVAVSNPDSTGYFYGLAWYSDSMPRVRACDLKYWYEQIRLC